MKLAYVIIVAMVLIAFIVVALAVTVDSPAHVAFAVVVGGSWLLVLGAVLLGSFFQKRLEAK